MSTPQRPRVGFVGLGDQGAPMARRIADAGFATTVWARRPETLARFADTPASPADSPAELGAASDIACICVVDDAGVEDVSAKLLSGMAPGGVLVVHSTVHPDTCRRLAGKAADHGVAVVDAPVSGGGQAARDGTLLVMAGGDEKPVRRCAPVFDSYADTVLHLGPVGAGQVAKILNNVLFTAHLATAHGIYAAARNLDVDLPALARILGKGSGASYAAAQVLPGTGFDLAALAAHAGPLLRKDTGLFADLVAGTDAGTVAEAVLAAADRALAGLGHPRPAPSLS